MMNFIKLFKSPTIEVEWDDAIEREIKESYRGKNNRAVIHINLFSFLLGLGSAQPKRTNPTLIKTMMDYGHLIERLYDTPEFKLKITETRDKLSSEMLTEVSELMGVGLSVAVVSELYDVQRSTIKKYTKTTKLRPDWECLLKDNRTLLVESKGSISEKNSNQQLKAAMRQKGAVSGDVRIATAAVLNEDIISTMQMVDPPVIGEGNNPYKRYVYRAFHYSSLFSFLGDEELSNYYDKMAKRLSGMIDNTEMLGKEILYNELNRYAPSIIIHGRRYVGHIFGTQEDYYFFLGVDKQLLSFHGFMNYENIEEQHFMFRDNGVLIISPDGVIVGLIKNLNDYFEDEPDVNKVLSYDNIAITDIDTIRDSSFKRYIKYLLDKCSKSTEWLSDGSLQANINGQNRIFYFYHSRNVRLHYPSKRNIEVLMNYESNMNGTLVTNLEIPTGLLNYPVVDRRDLEQITSKMADSNIIKEVFAR